MTGLCGDCDGPSRAAATSKLRSGLQGALKDPSRRPINNTPCVAVYSLFLTCDSLIMHTTCQMLSLFTLNAVTHQEFRFLGQCEHIIQRTAHYVHLQLNYIMLVLRDHPASLPARACGSPGPQLHHYVPTVHSQWASRNVRICPRASRAPRSRALTRPSRSRVRRTRVGTASIATCFSSGSFRKAANRNRSMLTGEV
jgi:hypothetical protein